LTTNCEAQIDLTDPAEIKKSVALAKLQTSHYSTRGKPPNRSPWLAITLLITVISAVVACSSCSSILNKQREARPLVLRDVPAARLAYRFEADVAAPNSILNEDANEKIEAIQIDFDTRRQNDALLRTVRSPDGQRALVLYGTEGEPSHAFRIDLYAADGNFLRNMTPPDLSCVFPETVSWSPDGNFITFIAHKSVKPTPTPTPPGASPPEVDASPLPSVAPAFAPVSAFNTEQIYICDRDGYDLKPLTSREGLIYFYSAWSPDNQAVLAMACRESEWDAREREYKLPTGRPRLITLDGKERLLDDGLTEALPVWSPDASKVATAFETDVMIYDAGGAKPTQARIRLRDALLSASKVHEEKTSSANKPTNGNGNGNESQAVATNPTSASIPASFNPIVRLEWSTPETLYFQTAYVRLFSNEPINTFQRWHLLTLSPQAAVLK
jgi:dipeptidyl aminopeptidase/acylaminoacyl peptidase